MDTEFLKDLSLDIGVSDAKIHIGYADLMKEFTDTDRYLVLYSNVDYDTEYFHYHAILPTVKIPYEDPSTGFLIKGSLMASTGVYQRAPGVILDIDPKVTDTNARRAIKVDIISTRNSRTTLRQHNGGVVITVRRNNSEHNVPMGVFLKAFSEMPYKVILDKIYYQPIPLLNSFLSKVPPSSRSMVRSKWYQFEGDEEPTIEECVNMVYDTITAGAPRVGSSTNYASQWKRERILTYFNDLHFKSMELCEQTLSIASRASRLEIANDQLLCEYFDEAGNVCELRVNGGDYVDKELEDRLRKYDVDRLAVVGEGRRLVLQEASPMVFRVKGYRFCEDVPEIGCAAGDLVTDEILDRLNASRLKYLEMETPKGRKEIYRSGEEVTFGDFVTLLNFLFTGKVDDGSMYDISHRIVLSYEKQVKTEVLQAYADICDAIVGCDKVSNIISALPKLPIDRLTSTLRDPSRRDIGTAELTNVLAVAISRNRSSALLNEAPTDMTAVQLGQFGRLDSLHVPESEKIGSVNQMTVMASINSETSELQTPYEIVENGVATGRFEQVTAAQERDRFIVAWDNALDKEIVSARCNDNIMTVPRGLVSYRDPSPFSDMSVSRATCPFSEFSQPKRAIMASKMGGQAVPLIKPERAIVSTGADTEVACMYYTAEDILKFVGLEPIEGEQLKILSTSWGFNVKYEMSYAGKSFTYSVPFMPTSKSTLYNYNVNMKQDFCYDLHDIVFYNQSCDIKDYDFWPRVNQGALPYFKDYKRPGLALGVNLRVGYKTFASSTIDDAIVISSELVDNGKLTNIQIIRYEYKCRGTETFDMRLFPPVHTFIKEGEPVIAFNRDKGGIVKKYFVNARQAGEVIHIQQPDNERKVHVWLASYHNAIVGDKMAGRHGNKSVIARVVPKEFMPYDPKTGESLQVICSPLGIPSRMNLGQVIEVVLGAAMQAEGKVAVVTPFYHGIKDEVRKEYEGAGLASKCLMDPVTGKLFERPIMVGVLYFLKLEQMANLKWSATGSPASVDAIFGQSAPALNARKGQSIAEMESWALIASGADKQLNTYYTLCADDKDTRRRYFDMLNDNVEDGSTWDDTLGEVYMHDDQNINAVVLQVILRTSGLDIYVGADNKYHIVPLDMDNIPVTITREDLRGHGEKVNSTRDWTKIALRTPTINPFWVETFPLNRVLGIKSVKTIVSGSAYVNPVTCAVVEKKDTDEYQRQSYKTGVEGLLYLLDNVSIDKCLERLRIRSSDETLEDQVVISNDASNTLSEEDIQDLLDAPVSNSDIVRFLHWFKREGKTLSELKMIYMPVLPGVFRQPESAGDKIKENSFQTFTIRIAEAGTASEAYEALRAYIGYDKPTNLDTTSIRRYFFGHQAATGEHGRVRERVMSKRVAFSGRTVIVPMEDSNISPFFVGLPWRVVMTEMEHPLAIRISKRAVDIAQELVERAGVPRGSVLNLQLKDWRTIIGSLYEYQPELLINTMNLLQETQARAVYVYMREVVRQIVEGNVRKDGAIMINGEWVYPETLPDDQPIDAFIVSFGRQPTLHRKSIRTYFVKLVDGYATMIHPIVCRAYNADFDGDQMWNAQVLGEAKVESCKTTSILQDLISEKDGSYTLELAQDVALGLYCLTTFKDNAVELDVHRGRYYYFDGAKKLRMALFYGNIGYADVVLFKGSEGRYYLSTAGRILVNSSVPEGLTNRKYTDKLQILGRVFGPAEVEAIRPHLYDLAYDCIWNATSVKAKGREDTVKIADVLLNTYYDYGARESIMSAQRLYEIGLAASDAFAISISLDDLEVDYDIDSGLEKPNKAVQQLNSLYQLGLLTEDERKRSALQVWDGVRLQTRNGILDAMKSTSNLYYMMMSGARGSPDQIMQMLGFIGNISKSESVDIEYPILSAYGRGLSAYDMMQTRYSARIGVVSTQTGTKDTGYATRQSVYMMSGLCVVEQDCGIGTNLENVSYDLGLESEDLVGKVIIGAPVGFDILKPMLSRTGGMITPEVAEFLASSGIRELELTDGPVVLTSKLAERSKEMLLDMYSYALPYTQDGKITEATLDWIERHGLRQVVAIDKYSFESGEYLHGVAYMPVDYDTDVRSCFIDGERIDEERLLHKKVDVSSERYDYYSRLLDDDGRLTIKALNYLSKCRIRKIKLESGEVISLRFKITDLWKKLLKDRIGYGLPYLNEKGMVTADTIDEIELIQLDIVAVRSGLTCMSKGGYCAKCYGANPYTGELLENGSNLGITAAQTMCEPLSQATLNVQHSGGKRTGLVSGMKYYSRLLSGHMVPLKDIKLLEGYAPKSGYVKQNKLNPLVVNIVDGDDNVLATKVMVDADRLAVPEGARVNEGDLIINGIVDLDRYIDRDADIVESTVDTRCMLIREYGRVLLDLGIMPKNYEVLARAQTSNCFLKKALPLPRVKDTGEEFREVTGNYYLRISSQLETVMKYSGIASLAFERVLKVMSMMALTSEGVPLGSKLGNILSGTTIGSEEALCIPQKPLDVISNRQSNNSKIESRLRDEVHSRGKAVSGGLGNGLPSLPDGQAVDKLLAMLDIGDEDVNVATIGQDSEELALPDGSFVVDYVPSDDEVETLDLGIVTEQIESQDFEDERDDEDIKDRRAWDIEFGQAGDVSSMNLGS